MRNWTVGFWFTYPPKENRKKLWAPSRWPPRTRWRHDPCQPPFWAWSKWNLLKSAGASAIKWWLTRAKMDDSSGKHWNRMIRMANLENSTTQPAKMRIYQEHGLKMSDKGMGNKEQEWSECVGNSVYANASHWDTLKSLGQILLKWIGGSNLHKSCHRQPQNLFQDAQEIASVWPQHSTTKARIVMGR